MGKRPCNSNRPARPATDMTGRRMTQSDRRTSLETVVGMIEKALIGRSMFTRAWVEAKQIRKKAAQDAKIGMTGEIAPGQMTNPFK